MNPEILALHQAYCDATGFDLPINPSSARVWYEVNKFGMSPDDVKLIVKGRIKRNLNLTYKRSIVIHKMFGDEDDIAVAANELAEIKANMRKPVYDAGKVTVLKATNRPTEPESKPARKLDEIFEQMRKVSE